MVSFKNILLLAVTVTAAVVQRDVVERDVNTIITNLKKIDSSTNALTKATGSWDGSASGSIGVQNAEAQIEKDIKAATSSAGNEKQATSANSKTVISYVTGTLTTDIKKALTAITNKKSQFAKAGLTSLVKKDLANLKSESTDLGAALKKVASNDQKTNAQKAIDAIIAAFNKTIADFSS